MLTENPVDFIRFKSSDTFNYVIYTCIMCNSSKCLKYIYDKACESGYEEVFRTLCKPYILEKQTEFIESMKKIHDKIESLKYLN